MDQTITGGGALVASKMGAFCAGWGVEEHSSNSMLPFFKRRAEPPKKEKAGASLSIQVMSAVFAVSSRWIMGTLLSQRATPAPPQRVVGLAKCWLPLSKSRTSRVPAVVVLMILASCWSANQSIGSAALVVPGRS